MNQYKNHNPIYPRHAGRTDTQYAQSIFLDHLDPLTSYDKIIVLFSGGKDSLACVLALLEMGIPKNMIELWHHNIDGGNPDRKMDWPVTQAYVRAIAEYLGLSLRISWRVGGFWGEVYRIGALLPVQYTDRGQIKQCRLSPAQQRSAELRSHILTGSERQELERLGYRLKFPAKSPDLNIRWCSSVLKIQVADKVLRTLGAEELLEAGARSRSSSHSSCQQGRRCSGRLKDQEEGEFYPEFEKLSPDIRVLIVSGERREESPGRSRYNEMEIHRCNATAKAHRLVHSWRLVIDWSEREIWEIIQRWHIAPHPCYACGWSRCSCMMCIFSLPTHWAGIRELFPDQYSKVEEDERRLTFTLDSKKSLSEYVGPAPSCVCHSDLKALHQLQTGAFSVDEVYQPIWALPAGAFHGSAGGPC